MSEFNDALRTLLNGLRPDERKKVLKMPLAKAEDFLRDQIAALQERHARELREAAELEAFVRRHPEWRAAPHLPAALIAPEDCP